MEECAAVIVTYYPDAEDLENIHHISEKVRKVYVVDNTPAGELTAVFSEENIILWQSKKNIGLAAGLNQGIELALADSFEQIFMLDQDSRPSDLFFREMLSFQGYITKKIPDYAFVVPNFFDKNSRSFAKFPVIGRYRFFHKTCHSNDFIILNDALIAITSGTLITKKKFKAIGQFREEYFIDFIDNEYCLRAHKLGFRVVVNCKQTLQHSIGKRTTEKWMGLTIKPNRHSSLRRYYIARNGVRTIFKYWKFFPSYPILIVCRLFHEILSIILFEEMRKEKLKSIGRGILDGLCNTMGSRDLNED